MSKNSLGKLKFIDIFSGCGGFSHGFEMAGHKCLLGVDFDKHAIETFKHNHPEAQTFLGDIKKLSKSELSKLINLKEVDMVIGGPPCQGFSTVGRGQVDDNRNYLFKEFVRIVKLTNPKLVIFENVTGLLAEKNRLTLKRIFKSFEKLGYHMQARVLSAEEYGTPEKRRRAIIVGMKGCQGDVFPEISHGPRGEVGYKTVNAAFRSLKASDGKTYNHDKEAVQLKNELDKKRLAHIPEGCGIRYEKDENAYLPKRLRYGIEWEKLPEGRFRQTKLQRLNGKSPSPTILTSRTTYYHPKEDRYLTPREAAACQGFPNDFVFKGSLTAQFRQIGNAVPPTLAKSLGETIKKLKISRKKIQKGKESEKYFQNAFTYQQHTVA